MNISQSAWKFVDLPNENRGIILGDFAEFLLNTRQTRRIKSTGADARWLGKPVEFNFLNLSDNDSSANKSEFISSADRVRVWGQELNNCLAPLTDTLKIKLDLSLQNPEYLIIPHWLDWQISKALKELPQKQQLKRLPLRIDQNGNLWVGPELSAETAHQWNCIEKHLKPAFPLRTFLSEQRIALPQFIPDRATLLIKTVIQRAAELFKRSSAKTLLKHGILYIPSRGAISFHRFWKCDHGKIKNQKLFCQIPRRWLSPLTGPIYHLSAVQQTHLPEVWIGQARAADSSGWDNVEALDRSLQLRGGGSAAESRHEALLAAACEAFERLAAVDDERIADYQVSEALTMENCLNWNRLIPLANWQLNWKNYRLPGSSLRISAPGPDNQILKDQNLKWLKLRSLVGQGSCLVPRDYILFGKDGDRFPRAHSDGLAADKTIHRSIIRGLMELIERDALGIWWHNGICRPRPPETAYSAEIVSIVRKRLENMNRRLWLLDLTHDIELPVVVAVSTDDCGGNVLLGAAADFDYAAAGRKAVLEMVQMLPLSWLPDLKLGAEKLEWRKLASIDSCPWIKPDSSQNRRSENKVTTGSLLRQLRRHNLKVYWINLSQPQIPVAVTKTIVPGLCSHRPLLGFKRLTTTPEQLGWKKYKNIQQKSDCLQIYW